MSESTEGPGQWMRDPTQKHCSQCGRKWAEPACGPTHAEICGWIENDKAQLARIQDAADWRTRALAAEALLTEVYQELALIKRGLAALNQHHRDDHHSGVDLVLDEDVAEAFLALRRLEKRGRCRARANGASDE